MSTTPAAPVTKLSGAKKFLTFLDHVGQDIEHGFAKVAPIVQDAEPYLSLIFPGFGPLFASTANEVISTEQKFAAIGQQSGSGTEKMSSVLSVIEPVAQQLFAAAKLPSDSATITNWINGVVGLLNGIPAPASAAPVA
jgi:hypothetical protein